MTSRSVSVLGATGSIGASTLDLIGRDPDRFRVVALSANRDVAKLAELSRAFRAEAAVVADEALLPELKGRLAGTGTRASGGPLALVEAAATPVDYTMAAIVGCAGLQSTLAAVARGGTVALANKEALVSAGPLLMDAVARSGATLLPVDSEHNAIFQCLETRNRDQVRRLVLTASGGPFRAASTAEMRAATPAAAVAHPNWSMGAKISVDSATLMNKGLELIEASYLFGFPEDRIDILVHPQSVIHSMVEYADGSTLAQLGSPDMRTPIAHTLAWPRRMASPSAPLDLARVGRLDFEAPDDERFPALRLCRDALRAGGAAPAVLNAANEVAVAAFLRGRAGFLEIAEIVGQVIEHMTLSDPATIAEVLTIDAEARRAAERLLTDRAA